MARSGGLARRFSTSLDNLKEEEHADENGYHRVQHSYHVDQRSVSNSNLHSQFESQGPSTPSPTSRVPVHPYFQAESSSEAYSTSDHGGGSDREQDYADYGVRRESSPGPSAPYLAMRRGSVRELMAINNLCLSSEEMERC
ncbi:hypothetical protein BGZ54_000611 [Gamsiella multidivaricata]|nr:hypothetical protein BGZ54_000611 [Gamsiella multidivaricata]